MKGYISRWDRAMRLAKQDNPDGHPERTHRSARHYFVFLLAQGRTLIKENGKYKFIKSN